MKNNEMLNIVNDIMAEYDVADVILYEEQKKDEYMSESKKIVKYLMENKNVDTLEFAEYLQDLFIEYFETIYAFELMFDLASDLLDYCKEVI